MHKRPISPTMLGFRGQSTVEHSTAIYTHNLNSPSRVPFTPLGPKTTSGHSDVRENGFVTPRSRGRSAIYNMARTPYSRVHPTATSKVHISLRNVINILSYCPWFKSLHCSITCQGVENALDVYGGNSSSQYAQGV